MADSHWKSANRMVDRLVAKHGEHPQTWLLRVSIRMCTSQLLGAIDDCKHLLSFDRDCYRACVFLGQSYWWMQRLEVARECFQEARRIYPNWSASGIGLIS
jgi:tetratricopeptide (TPR) repeat protein